VDKTDRQGEFFFVIKPRRGRYVASFPGKTITKPGYGYDGETKRCSAAKSRIIRIQPAR
jgi:hypothetical protein